MNRPTHTLLLILLTLALAFAPLRGALSLPLTGDAGTMDHCASMQAQARDAGQTTGLADTPATAPSDRCCDQGCADDCGSDAACNTCVHTAVALPGRLMVSAPAQVRNPDSRVAHGLAGRTPLPPFRPPIALQA